MKKQTQNISKDSGAEERCTRRQNSVKNATGMRQTDMSNLERDSVCKMHQSLSANKPGPLETIHLNKLDTNQKTDV